MFNRQRDGFFHDFGPSANVTLLMLSRLAISLPRKVAHQKNPSWLLCKPNTILSVFLTFAFDTQPVSCLV